MNSNPGRHSKIRMCTENYCILPANMVYTSSKPPMQQVGEEKDVTKDDKKKKVNAAISTLPFHKLLSYADALDWTLMALGTLGSVVHGMALPLGYLLLGKALNAYGDNIKQTDAMVHALYKVPYIFLSSTIYLEDITRAVTGKSS